MNRLKQLKAAFTMTAQADPKLVPFVVAALVAGFALFFALGFFLINSLILGIILGIFGALIAALIVFGRRATQVQMGMLEGQPGAAIAVLQSQRGFLVTPAIAFNKKQDMVHLVVGRCGAILIGEGRSQGTKILLKQEKQKMGRVSGDAPIHEILVGDGEGQVPLDKVRVEAMKFKRVLSKPEMYALHQKLESIAQKFQPKMPGGPTHQKRPKQR